MATPTTRLAFRFLRERVGTFGQQVRDLTRPGGAPTFKISGNRGVQRSIEGWAFTETRDQAITLIRAIEAAQGTEVLLGNINDNLQWQVMLQSVEADHKAIGGHATWQYRVWARMEVIRTA